MKLEALLASQRGALRVVVPLRNDKVRAESGGGETLREGVSAGELTERIVNEMVIEPPMFSSPSESTASVTLSMSCAIEGTGSRERYVAGNGVLLHDVGDNLGDRTPGTDSNLHLRSITRFFNPVRSQSGADNRLPANT